MGREGVKRLADVDLVLGLFSRRKGEARRRYRGYMEGEEGLKREEVYSTVDQRIQGDEDFAERVLTRDGGKGLERGRGKAYSLSQIEDAVEKLHGIKIKELRSSAKTRQITFGRQIFSLMGRECGYKGNEVAAYLHKDPSAVTVYARASEKLSAAIRELNGYLDQDKSQ
jgi:chromosomal replication initiation ATPase DnaA